MSEMEQVKVIFQFVNRFSDQLVASLSEGMVAMGLWIPRVLEPQRLTSKRIHTQYRRKKGKRW